MLKNAVLNGIPMEKNSAGGGFWPFYCDRTVSGNDKTYARL
jgi:hypothetical protein